MEGDEPVRVPAKSIPTVSILGFEVAPKYPSEVTRHVHSLSQNQTSNGCRQNVSENVLEGVSVNLGNTSGDSMFMVNLVDHLVKEGLVQQRV